MGGSSYKTTYYFLFILISLCCIDADSRRQTSQGYRLPDTIVPRKYNLEILTNLDEDNFSFEGKVLIKMQCVKSTNKIILHAKDLEIDAAKVTLRQISAVNETVNVPIEAHSYATENDFYIVELGQKLVAGSTYLFFIPFKGILNEGLAGYYRSSYVDKASNETKWLSVTQFESIDARRAFPCFDEPAMKATFDISLGHAKHLKAVSNMPLRDSKPMQNKKDWVMDRFEETVPMSTYLVAFMISEFEFSEAPKKGSNVTFRIWARKEAINQVELAKETGPKVLSYFAKYFDIEYPLPKQDMAAIPDFSAGAMENWGLITYRETALLYDPKVSSFNSKHSIASVISHELAHQWFGNLVTMKWWTDLWLNEGFATYVGALGVHHVYPEWKSLDSSTVNDFLTVLALDALESSHPVSVPIGHPREISQIFDTISYKKGSFLIRMMNMFLGEQIFQKSVANYLKKHRYSNAAQDDLWLALTQTAQAAGVLPSRLTVKMIMDTWTLQTGYPLVTVTRNYDNDSVTVKQERFLSSLDESKAENKSECWWVPLSYTSSSELKFGETKPRYWLTCEGPISFTTHLNDKQWILFNLKAAGLYRVNYDENNWRLLEQALADPREYHKIDVLNRVQLLSDSLGLAWTGKLDYRMPLDIVQYLDHENEYLPWRTALSYLGDIAAMLRRTPTFDYFKKFVRELLQPTFKRLKSITDIPKEFEAIKFHSLIVSSSCYYGVTDCEEQTSELFRSWFMQPNPDENNPIPKDLRGIVYCQALKVKGEKYWEFMWQRYQKSNVATEKKQILDSLGCIKDFRLLERLLLWSLDSSKIRKQDSAFVFAHVAGNEIGYAVAKEFFMKHFMEIYDYHSLKGDRLGTYVKSMTNQVTTEGELMELQSFFTNMKGYLKEADLSIKQGMERARNNIDWHSMHYESLSKFFAAHSHK